MIPLKDVLTVDGEDYPCNVGRPFTGYPELDNGVEVINRDRLLIIAMPGVLPESVSVHVSSPPIFYRGIRWDPLTTQTTHTRHGQPHHVSVLLGRRL